MHVTFPNVICELARYQIVFILTPLIVGIAYWLVAKNFVASFPFTVNIVASLRIVASR